MTMLVVARSFPPRYAKAKHVVMISPALMLSIPSG